MVKIVKVITSWITLSCQMLKGPPFSIYPNLFAGTWNAYSKRAINQLIRIMLSNPKLLNHEISLNLRCPYHANVMKVLEIIKKAIVISPLAIEIWFFEVQKYKIEIVNMNYDRLLFQQFYLFLCFKKMKWSKLKILRKVMALWKCLKG